MFSVVDSAKLSANVLSVDLGATVNTMTWDSYTLRVEFEDKQGSPLFVNSTFRVGGEIDSKGIVGEIKSA